MPIANARSRGLRIIQNKRKSKDLQQTKLRKMMRKVFGMQTRPLCGV